MSLHVSSIYLIKEILHYITFAEFWWQDWSLRLGRVFVKVINFSSHTHLHCISWPFIKTRILKNPSSRFLYIIGLCVDIFDSLEGSKAKCSSLKYTSWHTSLNSGNKYHISYWNSGHISGHTEGVEKVISGIFSTDICALRQMWTFYHSRGALWCSQCHRVHVGTCLHYRCELEWFFFLSFHGGVTNSSSVVRKGLTYWYREGSCWILPECLQYDFILNIEGGFSVNFNSQKEGSFLYIFIPALIIMLSSCMILLTMVRRCF